ncbi:MAG: ATP synthase F1 subunit gamma [Gaiellaceae bacterium]
MASVQDIKRRVRSVRNTRKITKAMELVAGAKLRRAATRIEAMRPYADRMLELMTGTARASASVRGLPLLQQREEVQTVLIVPFTADRGLAGGFNAQIMRHAFALERRLKAEGKTVRFAVVGKKGASTLRFRRYELDGVFQGFTDRPEYGDAQAIGHRLADLYTGEDVDEVIAIYNHFISPLVQRVTEQTVLPISEQLLAREDVPEPETEEKERARIGDFIYEPDPEEILARLLPVYLETELYRALLESAASEQGARMTAMRNASSNAGELIDRLTLAMNRARQSEITQEILEVVAGAEALTA